MHTMHTQGILRYIYLKYILIGIAVCSLFFILHSALAVTITNYSDLITESAPLESSNHTISFISTVPIPPNGYIRFTPEDGVFTIPASDFDVDNVALYVATSSDYHVRSATGTPSVNDDGVSIIPGTSGSVEVTLNSSVGIPAGARVRLLIGTHTENATGTDTGIENPSATGTRSFFLDVGDGSTNARVIGKIAIVDSVSVGPIDTRETLAPYRFNGAPVGTLSGTTLIVEISLETDEFAKCRYSTASGTPFFSMSSLFGTTFETIHRKEVSVAINTSYSFYVRCTDDEGNINTDDYVISFTVPATPEGTPGGEEGNPGSGGGGGAGAGSGGSGGGSSSGNSGGGGSAGGGNTGGTTGGGFESSAAPYQSGDGKVIITGYAFPRSSVTILVDGKIADEVTSASTGEFTSTLDQIARGAYTFGVYGTDKSGTKSSTFSTTFTVTGARGSTLSNINVMPSIKVSPNPVDPNSTLTLSGYSIPNATLTIENQNDKTSASLKTFTATSDASGAWSTTLSTDGFTKGTYKVRAKAKQESGVSTNFSAYTFYGVGEAAAVPRSSDLNRDKKVNLTDFSILLFWWNTNGGASNPPADINGDGKVSLTDFSILIFNWTG